ncbi:MAG: hypothetical protein ACK5V3_09595 [Bdellovibrionales bacterium]
MTKIFSWKKRLSEIKKGRSAAEKAIISGEISNFAAYLISNHRNEDFYLLAKHLPFTLNKRLFETVDEFFYYGSSLLEVAILNKNYEIYQNLKSVPKFNLWPSEEVPMINRWSVPLAKAVMEDPVFYKDALTIPYRGGPEFSPRIATYGSIPQRTLQRYKEVADSKNLLELGTLLMDLFPSGSVGVEAVHSNGKKSRAELLFEHTGYEFRKDPFVQLSILDTAEFHQGIFASTSYYKKKMQFNLRLYEYIPNPQGGLGQYRFLNGDKLNWIREMKVSDTEILILLERDPLGQRYENKGTKIQELKVFMDHEGRVSKMQIRNGNHLIGRALWSFQTVEFRPNARSFSNVYFAGEEDLSTTQMGN